MLEELFEEEQKISFSKLEIKEIRQRIKNGEIYEAHKTLLKEEEKKWQRTFIRAPLQYYRKECALAANYWKKGDQRPLLVIVHKDISDDRAFYKYYGTNWEGFFKRVYYGDFLPMVAWDAKTYTNNPYLANFFDRWAKNPEVSDFWPVYANRLEVVLARDKGYDDWAKFLQHVKKEYDKRFSSLKGVKLLPTGTLEHGDAFEYFTERIGRFDLLELNPLVERIVELLDSVIREKGDVIQPQDLEEVKNFTFSMFQLLGAHIFYSRGGIENISINDLDRICESMKGWEKGEMPQPTYELVEKGIFSSQLPTASSSERYLKQQEVDADLVEKENRIYYASRAEAGISHEESMHAYREVERIPQEMLAGNINDFEVERRVDKLEQALRGLSEQNQRAFSGKYDLINLGISAGFTGLSIGLAFLAPPVGIPIAIAGLTHGFASTKLKDHLISKRATEFVIPSHIWQYELTGVQFRDRIIRLPIFR